MIKKSNVAVFARMASRPVPRVQRGMKVAKTLGYEPVFCGAMRDTGLSREDVWAGWPIFRVGRPFPLLNGQRPLLYLISVLSFNWALLNFLRSRKPALIHASDVETMPASILYSLFARSRLIYNVHDNVAQRYNLPKWANALLNGFEGVLVLCSRVTMVPEEFRRDALPRWCRRKIVVVRNTPEDPGYQEPAFSDDGKIRIFYGGWLDWGRGLKEMVELAERVPEIDLRMAGEGADDIVAYLKEHPRVNFLGFIEYADSLRETAECHFIPAFYRPTTIINQYAASNKIAEALAVGRPLILNSEIKLVSEFGDRPCILDEKFGDLEPMAKRVTALINDRNAYMAATRDARKLYDDRYAWPLALKGLTDVFSDNKPA